CRPMTDADLPFSAALYASTRAAELARVGWPLEQQRLFLEQQHDAQHRHYRAAYPGAEWLIVERGGEAIGRLYLVEWDSELRVVDISLVPAARGTGIGGAILSDLIAVAQAAGKPLSIHVERDNRARRLYDRLGFETVEDKGVYLLMQHGAGVAGG
ncbi:MAG: GNAT family N-acetyltransferase, partial [Pseudomonadota bacterium]|nr:GNAT family N-acetyltransferase [Pseudomonadota bacterium]